MGLFDNTFSENEIFEELLELIDNPESAQQLDNDLKQAYASQNIITAVLETAPESVDLIKKCIDASIISSHDFCALFNKAAESQDELFIHLTYAAASKLELQTPKNFDPILSCFEYEFAQNDSLSSFQIAVLLIFSTNPTTESCINKIFLRALSTNPFIAEFIGEHFEIDRNELNNFGQNALQIAADYGQIEMFKFLIENPSFKTISGHFLSDEQYEQQLSYLTHRDQTKSQRPLLFSIAQSPAYKEILPIFIEKAKEISVPSPHSKHDRVKNFFEIFEAQDKKGNTWLTYLISRNVLDALERFKFFESCGVNLNIKDSNNKTILDYICKYFADLPQTPEIVEFLVKTCRMESLEAQQKFPQIIASAQKTARDHQL